MIFPPKKNLNVIEWCYENFTAMKNIHFDLLADWYVFFLEKKTQWELQADQAILGGFLADRMAYAFIAGYESALQKMLPNLPKNPITSLCVTEKEGTHPKLIKTTLLQKQSTEPKWVLSGHKTFVTCAKAVELLLVLASTGQDQKGNNQLKLVLIDAKTPGIEMTLHPSLSFLPEITHGSVTFEQVKIPTSQILEGDGYANYVKPFRTIEDIHLFLAMMGYFFRLSLVYKWSEVFHEELLHCLFQVRNLALLPADSSLVHLLFGGVLSHFFKLSDQMDLFLKQSDANVHQNWTRDRKFFRLAEASREKRLTNAREYFSKYF